MVYSVEDFAMTSQPKPMQKPQCAQPGRPRYNCDTMAMGAGNACNPSLRAPRSKSTPDDFTGPVNLGNPVEMPIKHLAERVIKLVGGKSKLVQARPLPVDDPLQRCPDITLAREKLKWEPRSPSTSGSSGGRCMATAAIGCRSTASIYADRVRIPEVA